VLLQFPDWVSASPLMTPIALLLSVQLVESLQFLVLVQELQLDC
jgi:hypothetical protein